MRANPVAVGSLVLLLTCTNSRAASNPPVPRPSQGIPAEVQRLMLLLRSIDSDDREQAANLLAREGPQAKPALGDLVALLDAAADSECVAAVRAICAIGPEAASAIPAMVKMARKSLAAGDDIPEHNCWAMPMGEVSSIGAPAIPRLLAELGVDPDTEEVPANMLRALGPQVLPDVVKLLDEGGVRAEAASEVIFRFGADAAPALPALVKALRRHKISEASFVSTIYAMNTQGMTAADAGTLAELRRLAKEAKDERLRLDADRVLRKLQPASPHPQGQ